MSLNTDLNIFNVKDLEFGNCNSYTELRISTLKEPIIDKNGIENLNPNSENFIKYSQKDLYKSKSSKNSFSSEIKISYKTELFQEIENNDIEKVSKILKNDISQINDYNIDGLTPLHLGVIKGNIDIINLLLEKGSNPNALSLSKNQTPLHFSYLNQNENTEEIIKDLMNHGAKDNILDVNNKKPSDYLNYIVNTSNSNNSINKKILINSKDNNLRLNNRINNLNNLNGNGMNNSQNSDKNISEQNSYETTIINSISSNKENKSNKSYNKTPITPIDNQNRKFINMNDLVTPIKYPCLLNLKEFSQNKEKNSINDSLEIENLSINQNINLNKNNANNNNDNNLTLLNENDIKNYKFNLSGTSFNDNVDLTYTTSIMVDQSNIKKNTNKKDNYIKYINNDKNEIKKKSNIISLFKKIDFNSAGTNVDEIYKELIMKKRDSIVKTNQKKENKIYIYNNSYNKTEENKNKKKLGEYYINNSLNTDINSVKNITIIHNSNSTLNNTNNNYLNKTVDEYYPSSTEFQTGKRNSNLKPNGNNTMNFINVLSEFKYDNSISEEENNKNENITSLANEIVNNSNNLKTIDEHINNSYNEMKKWLSTINLQDYYDNFINNDIYDINQLINRMKSYKTKLNISDIESILKIDKKGYTYRILVKLEIDAGLIDTKMTKFMITNINLNNNNIKKQKKNVKLSISQDFNNCFGCCEFNFLNTSKKNDLKYFLLRYGLIDLFPNFTHNGFDLINYVILQMYSDYPINEDILENCLHIYNYEKRIQILKALEAEIQKINFFLDSNEYNDNPNKDKIKYENIIFNEREENKCIYGKNNQKLCNDCFIF